MIERFAGRFLLLRRLGQGGMSEVFLARDATSGAECALKRLRRRNDAEVPASVRNEFEALTRVRHPTVVTVYELGVSPEGAPFYSMEYVPGLPADQAIGPGDWPSFFHVAARVAHGLEALHRTGVFHGDLKPSNLLVLPAERPGALPRSVRMLDFGLAAWAGHFGEGHAGTAGYAAPETVGGLAPDPASDLYGLGATLYTMLARRPPFEGDDASAVLRRQRLGPPSSAPLETTGAPPALVRLIMRLMANEPAERPPTAAAVRRELEAMHPAARSPLDRRIETAVVVGRERELARLESWWSRAPGRSPVLMLEGTAGAGKSALLGELGTRAALAGRRVIQLSCRSFEGSGAIAAALLRRIAAEAAVEPDTETLGALDGDGLREPDLDRLAEVASVWAAAAARDGALLVLLDDAERLDDRSRAWIRRVASRSEPAPIAWLWARPPLEAAEDDEAMLVDAGLAEAVSVEPLARDAVTELAATRLHDNPSPALVEWLWDRGGGHPGLTVDLLRRATSAGAIAEDEIGLRVDEDALARVGAPEDYESAVVARFEALPPMTRELAAALAVHGAALDVAGVSQLVPGAGVDAVEALTGAGFALRTAGGQVLLWPPVLADRVAAALSEERRRSLHRAALGLSRLTPVQRFKHLRGAGDAIAALDEAVRAIESGQADGIVEAAVALAEREVPERAAEWRERAGQDRMRRALYTAAIPHFEAALSRTTDREARERLRVALARAAVRAGRLDLLEKCAREALDQDLSAAARSLILADVGAGLLLAGDWAGAKTRSEEALRLALEGGSAEAEGSALQTLGFLATWEQRLDDAKELVRRVADAFARAGRPLHRQGIGLRAQFERARNRPEEAESLCREAVASAQAQGDRLSHEEHLVQFGAVLCERGKWSEWAAAATESRRLAIEDARLGGLATALVALATVEGLMGRPATSLRHAREALRLARRHRSLAVPAARRAGAQAYRIAGRPRRAEEAARKAVASAAEGGGSDTLLAALELAQVLAASERWKEARGVVDARLAGAHLTTLPTTFLAIFAGRAAVHDGAVEDAEARLAEVEAWLARNQAPYAVAQALWLKAEIAFKRGRFADGFETGQQALERLAALPAPADRAEAALEMARLAPPSGDPSSRLHRWLEIAAVGFERLGNRRGREQALALLVESLKRGEVVTASAESERGLIERVSWLLHSITDLNELAQRAMKMAVEQLDAERGVLLLHDLDTEELRAVAEYGAMDAATRNEAMRFSRRVVRRVTESGGSILIEDAWSDPRAKSESVRNLKLLSIVCVPLYLGGAVVGAVYLDDSRRTHRFGEAERGVLEGFAHLISVALEKARGHQEIERMKDRLEEENLSLRQEVGTRFQFQNLIGTSSEMRRVLSLIEPAARAKGQVLITGENGTGKELVARTLHHSGPRAKGPFVALNCGAIPETLVESELFGIMAYVATNVRGRDGRFVQANGGTLFLDEIGEMPLAQQVALLQAIANREITPVGGGKPIPVDVRIVAATNRDLRKMVEEKLFREDLFYRLAVFEIDIPPLRDRKADIPALARHFIGHFAEVQEREMPRLSPDFIAVLMQSDWPGNVRELQNYIERVVAMNPGPILRPDPLPRDLQERAGTPRHGRGRGLMAAVGEIERRMVTEALQKAGGNQSRAARLLGLTEQSLRYRLRKYGLAPRENRRSRQE